MTNKKTYLGDAVYASISEWGEVTLTTENGYEATNAIVMEPEVLETLLSWLKTVKD